ncbi:hypothetical protein V1281_007934 [Nitrobacteraceae bacterium AZCC 2161]
MIFQWGLTDTLSGDLLFMIEREPSALILLLLGPADTLQQLRVFDAPSRARTDAFGAPGRDDLSDKSYRLDCDWLSSVVSERR